MNETMFGPWRKSGYSGNESACVELAWQRSSHSGNEGNCVELTYGGAIRDSKNPAGGRIEVSLAGLITLAKSR
jgi:uncharacterized protein DUF397